MIRARGHVAGGEYDGSGWFVESLLGTFPQTTPSILTDASLRITSNHFGFNLSVVPGQTLVVEGSFDLIQWTALSTNTTTAGLLNFTDPAAASQNPGRFYRTRLWP
jgi:hypothetical protein